MLKNYFKVAIRSLFRNKFYSTLNIAGLAVGITAFYLIFQWVRFEMSYDSFHLKADRIYRVANDIKTADRQLHTFALAAPVALNLKKDFPEVEDAVRLTGESLLFRKGNTKFIEKNITLADSTLFRIFDFPWIEGNKNTALNEPMSVVLSESTAKKYFGHGSALGQHIILSNDNIDAIVTGVMKDIPENSQLKADVFLSMGSWEKVYGIPKQDTMWRRHNYTTYVLLKPHADAAALDKKLPGFMDFHDGAEERRLQMFESLTLEPLRDVYLRSDRGGQVTGSIHNVYIFSIIAVFILLIACINFINLTTARSMVRAKEVGVRKVVGAARGQVAAQFMVESVLLCWAAFIIALVLGSLLMPAFNHLAGKQISSRFVGGPIDLMALFSLATFIGLAAGVYPSLILSSYKAISVLKGRFATSTQGWLLRKGLVVFQFTVSIILIVGTIVVFRQLHFMRSQDLGFNKEEELIISTYNIGNKVAYRQSLASVPGVISTCFSSAVPGEDYNRIYTQLENAKGEMQKTVLNMYFVDFDYLHQYNIQTIAGRPFMKYLSTDSAQAMMVNETAVRTLGYTSPEAALGKRYEWRGNKGIIIGVFSDFNYTSLKDKVLPLALNIETFGFETLSVKVSKTNMAATIAALESNWNKLINDGDFEYRFLDEELKGQYQSEDRFGALFFNFAILAIFISCLGILGLASYNTFQRTKEMGVRKVLGASTAGIVKLLSIDFIRLVGLAFLIAAPIAWYSMHLWLEGFAYRTSMTWGVFVLAGGLSLLVVLLTIGYQAIKAAVANPVKSLRTE